MATSKHGQTTSQNLYGVGKMGSSGRIQLNYDKEDVAALAEIMRSSGRSLLMSMSKALGFDSERWDLHNEAANHEEHAMEAWNWYHDHKDLLIQKIQEFYEKQ